MVLAWDELDDVGEDRLVAFQEYLFSLGLNPRTMAAYLRHVQIADRWLATNCHTSLKWAAAAHIAAYAAAMLVMSHSTRGQAAAAFRHYWAWAERTNPPAKAVRVPPRPVMVCRALEEEPAQLLAKAAIGWWPKGTAVLFGLYMALRRTEIAMAEWRRFDGGMEWYTVTGKRSVTATLPVHPVLAGELEARRGSGWIFQGRFGGPVTPATIWSWTTEVAEVAGVGYLTTHQLRHTSLATANDRLGDLRAVQTFARHVDPAQTAGYTRTTARRLRDVSDSLDYL